MGRGKNKGRGGRRGGGGEHRPNKPRDASWKPYSEIVKKNEKLERFYNTLLDLSTEDRQAEFWDALRRELPNSFRFCGSKGHALVVRDILRSRYIPELQQITHNDGQPVEPPRPVAWYPDELAWSMATSKSVVRRFPPFARFQKFLVSETNVGNMSRQEVVSMIPPLFMDLRPGMAVLDMCAAPGSKSAQLVEMLHAGEEARVRKVLREYAAEDGLDLGPETEEERNADLAADPTDSGRATGLLVANDADYKRAHTLVHQLKRLSSPNIVVVNHDATMFPAIRLPSEEGTGGKPRYLKFDRVLADVPCSGDGTLRKNYGVWRDWVPANGLGLHVTQHRILVKALQALKVGGRVVYSTCSMNPVENEAVVSAAIDRCGGPDKVEIVDCADKIPGLKRLPGMRSWKIMDRSGTIWNSWKEVKERAVPDRDGRYPERVAETMFPCTDGPCADLPLDRCMRFYAHLQDTGAFFVAVLEKKGDIKARNEKDARPAAATNANGDSQAVANGVKRPREDNIAEGEASKKAKTEGVDEASRSDSRTQGLPVHAVANDDEAATANGHSVTSKGNVKAEQNGDSAEAATENGPAGTRERISEDIEESSTTLSKSEDIDSAEPPATYANQGYDGKKEGKGYNEEPFKFLPPDHAVIQNIVDFYKLSPRFPRDRWMVRNAAGEPAKAIYYTSALVRDVLMENEGRGVRFIQAGVKMFMRQDAPAAEVCRWRIQSEGMALVQGYVGEARVVHLRNKETLRKLLVEMFPVIKDGRWQNFDEIGERVRDIPMGCAVLRVEPKAAEGDDDLAFRERMALPLWKSIHSLNLMLPKEDRAAMLLRVFDDTTPLVNLGLQKDEKKVEAEEGEGVGVRTDAEAGLNETPVGDVAGDDQADEVDVADMPTPDGMDD